MKHCYCNICGKTVNQKDVIPLQIAYNVPTERLYMTLNTYCPECNKNIVRPTFVEITKKLALGYEMRGGAND